MDVGVHAQVPLIEDVFSSGRPGIRIAFSASANNPRVKTESFNPRKPLTGLQLRLLAANMAPNNKLFIR